MLNANISIIIGLLWFGWILYWAVSAKGVKKNIQKKDWRKGAALRLLFVIFVVIFFQVPVVQEFYRKYSTIRFHPALAIIGLIICASSLAFAIWARRHLGRNWSPHPSVQENHELVTSGPYALVRHPIYTGLIFAMFGTALAIGFMWLIVFVAVAVPLMWRIPEEERIMAQLFPNDYPAYKKRTKVLIPFVY